MARPTPAEMAIDMEAVWNGPEKPDSPEDWDGVTPFAVREGSMQIGVVSLRVAVLNDGRRIFNADAVN